MYEIGLVLSYLQGFRRFEEFFAKTPLNQLN